jgi:membrane-bound lytic murein transglycosylase D
LALALVAKDPALYGVQVAPDAPPKFDTVKPAHPVDLRLVADATGVELDDLRVMNPELLRLVTPDDSNFVLKVPVGSSERLKAGLAQVPPDKWTSWRLHRVTQGETLAEIAKQYRVTPASIRESNHMGAGDEISSGDALTIPAAAPRTLHLVHYKVRRGDTLDGIAEQFSVTSEDVRRWNHIRGNAVPRGSHLRIYEGGDPSVEPHAAAAPEHASKAPVKATHETAQARTKADQSEPALRAGSSPETKTAHAQSASQTHKVKPGETLFSIARQYGTSVGALRDANPALKHRSLEAGAILNVTAER